MKPPRVTAATVQAYFDAEVAKAGPLLPDPTTVTGLGTYRLYGQAADLMADSDVGNVLDIGCNRGPVELLFHRLHPAKATTTPIHGVDVSSKAIEQASALLLPNCTFRHYDGSILPYESNAFDLVLMIEVIEHVINKEGLLREVWRVLTPSGRLFLTTPNPECWALRAEFTLWWGLRVLCRRPLPAKDAFISNRELVAVLSRAGFPTAARSCGFAWPHLFLHFLGWSLLPPLTPNALYRYQQGCLKWLDAGRLPDWINRRVQWSSIALVSKGA